MIPIGNKQYVLQQKGDDKKPMKPIGNKQYVLQQEEMTQEAYETDRE